MFIDKPSDPQEQLQFYQALYELKQTRGGKILLAALDKSVETTLRAFLTGPPDLGTMCTAKGAMLAFSAIKNEIHEAEVNYNKVYDQLQRKQGG